MAESCFFQPVKIYFGEGELDSLSAKCAEYGYSKGLLIIDRMFLNTGLAARIVAGCAQIKGVFSDITPNPRLCEVESAAEQLRAVGADFAVAVGGGSALDLAKFACSLANAEYSARDYFYKREVFGTAGIPLIAVPTTAGTGSEVTAVSVCNDELCGVKAPLAHPNFYPQVAIIDPVLTYSVPPFVTAATGLDALSHALEGFWSVKHNEVADLFAENSAKLIFENLEKVYNNGADSIARRNMSLAALYAGMAFAVPKTAGVHACSYPLSEQYKMSHGEACAFTLDSFIRLNALAESGRVDALAKRLGFCDAYAMALEVKRLKKVTGMRCSLRECGITDVEALAKACHIHPLMNNNPRNLSVDEIADMFGELTNG